MTMPKFTAVLLGADSYPDQETVRQFKAQMPAADWEWVNYEYTLHSIDFSALMVAVMEATVVVAYAKDKEQALDWLTIQEASERGMIMHIWGLSREELAEQMS